MGEGKGKYVGMRKWISNSSAAALFPCPPSFLAPLPTQPTCVPRQPPRLLALLCRRLGEIQSVAGQAAPRQEVLDALVGGDFDPEEYDRQMAAAFGEDYYGAVSALGRAVVMLCCARMGLRCVVVLRPGRLVRVKG